MTTEDETVIGYTGTGFHIVVLQIMHPQYKPSYDPKHAIHTSNKSLVIDIFDKNTNDKLTELEGLYKGITFTINQLIETPVEYYLDIEPAYYMYYGWYNNQQKTWFKDGQIKCIKTHDETINGITHYEEWWYTGFKRFDITYNNHERAKFLHWSPVGKELKVAHYKDGVLDGYYKNTYADNKVIECTFKMGNPLPTYNDVITVSYFNDKNLIIEQRQISDAINRTNREDIYVKTRYDVNDEYTTETPDENDFVTKELLQNDEWYPHISHY